MLRRLLLFDLPPSLALFYFLNSCVQSMPLTANQGWLLEELAMPQTTVNLYYAVTFMPWSLKPLYALLADCLPLCGYHFRPWLAISSAGSACCYVLAGVYVKSIGGAIDQLQEMCRHVDRRSLAVGSKARPQEGDHGHAHNGLERQMLRVTSTQQPGLVIDKIQGHVGEARVCRYDFRAGQPSAPRAKRSRGAQTALAHVMPRSKAVPRLLSDVILRVTYRHQVDLPRRHVRERKELVRPVHNGETSV